MAYSYSQLLELKSRVERELAATQTGLSDAIAAFSAAEAKLAAMGSTYGQWTMEVDALALAAPEDTAAAVLKAQKDALVAEFSTASARAVALKNAVAEV